MTPAAARGRARGWASGWRCTATACAVAAVAAACSAPPMAPLTSEALADAERRWQAHGPDSYRLVVRVRAPRVPAAVYSLIVADGAVVRVERDGRVMRPEDARDHDYSVPGMFALLRDDLRLADVPAVGDTPPLDLRARFERETGRLVRYRRTVGSARRRVLLVEVLEYQPLEPATRMAG